MKKMNNGSSDPTKTDTEENTLKPETKTLWLHPDDYNRSGCVFTDSSDRKLNARQDILELLTMAGYTAHWDSDYKHYSVEGISPDYTKTVYVLKDVPIRLGNIPPVNDGWKRIGIEPTVEIYDAYKTAMKDTWKPVVEKLNEVALKFWMKKQIENGKVNHKKYEFKIGCPR